MQRGKEIFNVLPNRLQKSVEEIGLRLKFVKSMSRQALVDFSDL